MPPTLSRPGVRGALHRVDPHPAEAHDDDGVTGPDPAGFWLGLWQGFIVPVTFVISLFTDDVSIYEVKNSGNWYDFGYVLGISAVLGGGAGGGGRASRR